MSLKIFGRIYEFCVGTSSYTKGCDSIFIVVDRFSKMAQFIPYHKTFNASHMAKLFLQEVMRLHGAPNFIIYDQDSKFLATFLTTLWMRFDTFLKYSSTTYPQTDG